MKILGLILFGAGVSFIGGGVFSMPYRFGQQSGFLEEYRKAKSENREPTLDQKAAYANQVANKIGLFLVIFGGVIWFV